MTKRGAVEGHLQKGQPVKLLLDCWRQGKLISKQSKQSKTRCLIAEKAMARDFSCDLLAEQVQFLAAPYHPRYRGVGGGRSGGVRGGLRRKREEFFRFFQGVPRLTIGGTYAQPAPLLGADFFSGYSHKVRVVRVIRRAGC